MLCMLLCLMCHGRFFMSLSFLLQHTFQRLHGALLNTCNIFFGRSVIIEYFNSFWFYSIINNFLMNKLVTLSHPWLFPKGKFIEHWTKISLVSACLEFLPLSPTSSFFFLWRTELLFHLSTSLQEFLLPSSGGTFCHMVWINHSVLFPITPPPTHTHSDWVKSGHMI